MIEKPSVIMPVPVARPRTGGVLHRYEARMGYLFISPAMILFAIFTVLPLAGALILSFTNYDIISRAQWVGLANYAKLLQDDLFRKGLQNVLYYVVMYVPFMVGLSLLLALALNRPAPGMSIYRTLYYLPMISSSVAASIFWSWMLQRDYGAVNQILSLVGINGPAWLQNSNTAMIAIVMVTVWQGLGGNMIIYLAGLQGVPKYQYEAATIDGANTWQQFVYITWPSLRPTTFFVTIMALIGSFQLFDQAYVLTQGGPGGSTTTAVYQIYQNGFNQLRMGYASAQAFVLFIIIIIVSLINLRINREQNII